MTEMRGENSLVKVKNSAESFLSLLNTKGGWERGGQAIASLLFNFKAKRKKERKRRETNSNSIPRNEH